jgi:hypothetical protein
MCFRRIDILRGVDENELREAAAAAASHQPTEIIPGLRYTEKNPRWTLLYKQATGGQIDPRDIRRLNSHDLSFLAGMTDPHPEIDVGKKTKLLGNVARATQEVQRRATKTAAIVGGSVGALVATVLTLLIKS